MPVLKFLSTGANRRLYLDSVLKRTVKSKSISIVSCEVLPIQPLTTTTENICFKGNIEVFFFCLQSIEIRIQSVGFKTKGFEV